MPDERKEQLVELGRVSEATEGFHGYPMESDGLWTKEGISDD